MAPYTCGNLKIAAGIGCHNRTTTTDETRRILDARMPMVTGYDAARMIAKESPEIPVVFLSARGMHREITLAFGCGPMVVDYLVKPISPQQLVDRVENVIEACRNRGMASVREENMARELVTEW